MLLIWGVAYGDKTTPHIDSIGAFHQIELYGAVARLNGFGTNAIKWISVDACIVSA